MFANAKDRRRKLQFLGKVCDWYAHPLKEDLRPESRGMLACSHEWKSCWTILPAREREKARETATEKQRDTGTKRPRDRKIETYRAIQRHRDIKAERQKKQMQKQRGGDRRHTGGEQEVRRETETETETESDRHGDRHRQRHEQGDQ